PCDAVIIDVNLPDTNGVEVARDIRRLRPDQQILFFTGENPSTLSLLLKSGLANGFVPKNGLPTYLLDQPILEAKSKYQKATSLYASENANEAAVERSLKEFSIVGKSPLWRETIKRIKSFRDIPQPILIYGESGTGKELVAQALRGGNKKF